MKRQSGYTLIEVMMALTVLAIGAAGIFALQSVAIRGNSDAQDITAATNVARWWIELIKTDAVQWNFPGPTPANDQNDTQYLAGQNPPTGNWVTLAQPAPAVGILPMTRDGRFAANGDFCAHARFQTPTPAAVGVPQAPGIEVTVRVWWFKGGFHNAAVYPNCGAGQEALMTPNLIRFHWVYLTTLVTPHDQS
ncbi:MAG: prepilin-type N-terminal cleavage/methylation domain-containing protein [Deltaproteobacteria bacterium]|nr:prepilin-type N-terminal cleavage/methylation domain-containing protein [Deltaproteobacteria bacterium]